MTRRKVIKKDGRFRIVRVTKRDFHDRTKLKHTYVIQQKDMFWFDEGVSSSLTTSLFDFKDLTDKYYGRNKKKRTA